MRKEALIDLMSYFYTLSLVVYCVRRFYNIVRELLMGKGFFQDRMGCLTKAFSCG